MQNLPVLCGSLVHTKSAKSSLSSLEMYNTETKLFIFKGGAFRPTRAVIAMVTGTTDDAEILAGTRNLSSDSCRLTARIIV